MNTISHEQAQQLIRAGRDAPAEAQLWLAAHLETCPECRAYAALVGEISRALPAIYPAPAHSRQRIRRLAAASAGRLRRESLSARLFSGARAAWGTAALALLLILAIISPRLLPGLVQPPQTGGAVAPAVVVSAPAEISRPDGTEQSATLTARPSLDPVKTRQETIVYTVLLGDSLFSIADAFDLTPQTILWANYETLLDDPHRLRPGLELRIPAVDGLYHRARLGDTVQYIADAYNVDPESIRRWPENRVYFLEGKPDQISPGTVLFLPGAQRPYRYDVTPPLMPTLEATLRATSPP